MIKRIWAQCIKELSQFRRDPVTVGLAFLLPLGALMLYGFAIRLEVKDMPVAVINFDSGKLSREFTDRLFATRQLVPVAWSGTDVMEPLDAGVAFASVVIPPEFSRAIKDGTPVRIQTVVDATDVNNARVIKNIILGASQFFMKSEGLSDRKQTVDPEIRLWFNPGRKETLYIVPGTLALVLWVFPSLLASIAMTREKEQGTILQVYASSMSAFELIVGKAAAYTVIGLSEAALVIAIALLVFGLDFRGNALAFLIYVALYVCSSTNFGLLCGSVASTQNAAVQLVATLGFTTAMLLSGFIYPLRNIVYPLSLISEIVPARYFVQASRDAFVRGSAWYSSWYIPLALTLANLLFLFLSTRKLRVMQLEAKSR